MRKLIAVLFVLMTPAAFAGGGGKKTIEIYTIGKTSVEFIEEPAKRLLISKSCESKNDGYQCSAFKALKALSKERIIKKIRNQLRGGKNPGSYICIQHFRAKLVIGVDRKGGENSFCQFRDGSMIDAGTLTYFAERS